jgi:ribosomal-protein-alanine N-acetyltransferase
MPGTVFLTGENINLRTIEKEDIGFLRDGVNHPEVRVHTGNKRPQNLENEEEFFEHITENGDEVHFLICKDSKAMGVVSLIEKEQPAKIAKTGIWLHPKFHGKGYGTEAIEILIEHAFNQLNYSKIYARAHEHNKASQRIWEKLGFEKEGELRNHVYLQGEHKNLIYYGLLKGERE